MSPTQRARRTAPIASVKVRLVLRYRAAAYDQGTPQSRSAMAAIREHMAQLGCLAAEPYEDAGRAVTIRDIGRMDLARDQVAAGVGDNVTFAPLASLAGV